jgi:galactose oxidase
MANLGNAWHIPGNPEPRGRGAMRDPVGAIVPGTTITIFSGNQFRGPGGNPGNQLQTGSSLFFKGAADANWSELPMKFDRTVDADKNKYYSATIPADTSSTFHVGEVIQYYLRIAYDDHDTTFLHANGNGNASTPTDNEGTAQAAPFTFTLESNARWGQWAAVFTLPNVAIHTHVLPNGRVLMWGRRDTNDLDDHVCTPFVWDPKDPTEPPNPMNPTAPPTAKTTDTIPKQLQLNLFCSGHAFLPDGRLLVVGGHRRDSDGLDQATLYDPATSKWTPIAKMNAGRWYPTATTLPDGSVLVLAGSYKVNGQEFQNDLLQVWKDGAWKTIKKTDGGDLNFFNLPLYPRMHVASDGRVFMSGTNAQTYMLKTSNPGMWTPLGNPGGSRKKGERQYAPAVMYGVDKVIYIGGGSDAPPPQKPSDPRPPTAAVEVIDLGKTPRKWREIDPMKFRRRHHNATLLPDGTVLVTGGTRGGGPPDMGFNDLAPGQPVHIAELWDPVTKEWTELAAEQVDRCYHATTVLLPDARVLSAGGGEYRPGGKENPPEDSHREAQIFSPPYLFKGERPEISSAPNSVSYGQTFQVGTPQSNKIDKVRWIRLPSVTHAFDQNQRINVLDFVATAGTLTVTAPASANLCPPGHYMLFILSKEGVPSIARIIQIKAAVTPAALAAQRLADVEPAPVVSEPRAYLQVYARQAEVAEAAKGTAVVIGLTGTCPYGIGACWGGAYEALHHLEGVELVNPMPNADDSTAEVFLEDERLPALDKWDEQFRSIVNGNYVLRGVEVTLQGGIEDRDGTLFLDGSGQRPEIQLVPLAAEDRIQWNQPARTLKPLEEGEERAYERLAVASRNLPHRQQVTITGPLKQTDMGYRLHVRLFR